MASSRKVSSQAVIFFFFSFQSCFVEVSLFKHLELNEYSDNCLMLSSLDASDD